MESRLFVWLVEKHGSSGLASPFKKKKKANEKKLRRMDVSD